MAPAQEASPGTPRRALLIALALSLGFVVIEAGTGVFSGSLALLSDAGHTLTDSLGLVLALGATTLGRRSPDARRTYGYARAEVLAIPIHAILLIGIAGYIVYESIQRFANPVSIETGPVILVGLAGVGINLAVVRMLHSHQHASLNARAATLEAAIDALGSAAVVASSVFIAFGGWRGADALVGVVIAVVIVPRAWALVREAADILLEAVPHGLDPLEIISAGEGIEGVLALHDVHVWSIAPRFPALSAHVEIADFACTEHILTALATVMRERFGIAHVTLQPETEVLHEAMECCTSPDSGRLGEAPHIHALAGHRHP
ncbi:MAG TPA: cation diffusion facilitator family transporter [Tepidiformaceae bacterium]|nr:cation diffusion facilitator family transporter [Tepidiformaceae bacterium]